MSRTNRKTRPVLARWLALAAIAAPAAVLACGGWFPNRSLDHHSLISAPVNDFHQQLDAITIDAKPIARAKSPEDGQTVYEQTADGAIADLQRSLRESLTPPDQIADRVAKYREHRESIAAFLALRDAQRQRLPADEADANIDAPNPPAVLPGEFLDYERGAVRYHSGNLDGARAMWKKLLNRPADERRYRTVWAAYMLGRTYQDSDPAEAAQWFARARASVEQGFVDSIGLAAASYGWEARAYLDGDRPDRAIELYLLHRETGDVSAMASLQTAAGRALTSDAAQLRRCAQSPSARAVVTAYVLSEGGRWGRWGKEQSEGVARWVEAVEAAGVNDMAGAERLAWMSYKAADFDRAKRWADRAGEASAMALWIRAKLLMRAGKIDAARRTLATAVRRMPAETEWPSSMWTLRTGEYSSERVEPALEIRAEAGALALNAGDYAEALRWLLAAENYWYEAAYVAEQVMTADELKAFVDTLPPDDGSLRNLLARRLTRIGRWREGRRYFNDELRDALDRYIAAIRAGHDPKLSRQQRAEHFWTAATIARQKGDALLGTELDPDGMIHGGSFEVRSWFVERSESEGELSRAGSEESTRVQEHQTAPYKRFHYRYTAADHAWSCVKLMQDNTDQLAQRLQTAGMWLAARDPHAADRFYKALVIRCGQTELGQEADRLRWFPAAKKDR